MKICGCGFASFIRSPSTSSRFSITYIDYAKCFGVMLQDPVAACRCEAFELKLKHYALISSRCADFADPLNTNGL